MSGRAQLTGLDALIRDLTNAPVEVRNEGMAIVRETTESAASEITHAYPVRSGTLRQRVKTSYPASGALVGVVRSTAPHSHLYEFGTKDRKTRAGAGRGRMPSADVIVGIAQRWRERMVTRLMVLFANKGFLVSRDDA